MLIDQAVTRADKHVVAMAVEKFDLERQAVGMRDVVGIHARYILASGQAQTYIERLGQTHILGISVAQDARIRTGIEQGRRRVSRGIVDDDEFEILETLTEDAVDGGLQVSLAVIDGH